MIFSKIILFSNEILILTDSPADPLPTYVSVYEHSVLLRFFTFNLLVKLSSEKITLATNKTCEAPSKICRKDGNNCLCSTTYNMNAISPAIDPDTLEIVEKYAKEYGVWTESKWSSTEFKIFLAPSPTYRISIGLIGFFICLASFAVNYLFRKHFCDLFCLTAG